MPDNKQRKRARRNYLGRIGMMSVLPYLTFPHIFSNLFGGNLSQLMLAIGVLIAFSYGLFELRQGLKLEAFEQHDHHGDLVRSGLSKIRGVFSIGAGMAFFAYMSDPNLLNVLGIAGVSMGAAAFAVGLPQFAIKQSLANMTTPKQQPLRKSPLEVALGEAQEKLQQIAIAASQMYDNPLRTQVFGVHDAARAVVEALERDVSDLPKAQRFLVTYLDGAVKIVQSYVGQSDHRVSAEMREKFSGILVTMETTFVAQLKRLQDDNAMDLDIQMDVLEAQMKGEGVL